MTPLLLLATGIAVVIGGIVFLRLHAALALLLAAITVGVFTPAESIISYAKDTGKTAVPHWWQPGYWHSSKTDDHAAAVSRGRRPSTDV